MKIGRFFKSLINSEVMGEEIVKSIIHLYEQTARYNPGDSTHDLLLKTYLARLKARRININDERVLLNAMADIQLPSQLPEGKNIKALAIYCLFKERPDIIESYPKFAKEYERLMTFNLEESSFDNGDRDSLAGGYERNSTVPEEETANTNRACPSCGAYPEIQQGKAVLVNCPNCNSNIKVDQATRLVERDSDTNLERVKDRHEILRDIDKNFYKNASEKYAAQKEKNRVNKTLFSSNNSSENIIVPAEKKIETISGETLEWLRENSEYYERKKRNGRELSDYEQGIIDQYKSALSKGT
jgi:predicted RNA-binding Zn-ribbon protein involved in translation (DUF1610 family)